TLGLGAVSLLLLAAFIAREATARNPLIPLGIFRSRNVSSANVMQALLVAGMFGTFFLGSLYLEKVQGYDPLQIGLAFLPATLVVGGALGLAVLATLSATRSDDLVAAGHSTASALTSGYHLAFLIGAALVLVAIAVAVTVLEPVRRPQHVEAMPEAAELAYSE